MSDNIVTVTPTEFLGFLEEHFKTKRPMFVRGGPGVGKSSIIKQFCEAKKIGYVDLRVLYYDPTDLKGMPHLNVKDRTTEWFTPSELPTEGEGCMVLEELNAAPPLTQAACYQLLFERQIADYKFPDGWFIVATGNRLQDKAVVNKIPSPLVSRFASHVTLDVSVDDWTSYAVQKNLAPEVIAFFRLRRELLNGFDPAKWTPDTPYCCPRTAEFLAEKVAACAPNNPSLAQIASCVGAGTGAEFFGFLDIYKEVPSLEQILLDPKGAPVPPQPDARWAVVSGLARKVTKGNVDRVFTELARVPKEFEVCSVRDAMKICKEITATSAFVKWASANTAILSS
jgi:hypothetical protein